MNALRTTLASLFVSLSATSLAIAQIWYVDDGGGAGIDFIDIQPAIDAASGGDIIIVYSGNYSGFSLGKDLTLLGYQASDTSVVTGPVTIAGLMGPQRAVLTGFRMLQTVVVENNDAPIILDSLNVAPASAVSAAVTINNCSDVRMYQCNVAAPTEFPDGVNGVDVLGSRFEAVDSVLRGSDGYDVSCSNDGGDGGTGLWAAGGSILSVFQTSSYGGRGGHTPYLCEWNTVHGGDGGDGLYARGGSVGVVAGNSTDRIEHGLEGYGSTWSGGLSGQPGWGLRLQNSSMVRYSGTTITTQSIQTGSTATLAVPSDPFLERTGTLQAGRKQTFTINGPPGSPVTFYLGRNPIVAVDPSQEMDDLVTHERTYDLGVIPASGKLRFEFTIPAFFPIAFSIFAQAEVTTVSGDRLTNSLPIVLRHLP